MMSPSNDPSVQLPARSQYRRAVLLVNVGTPDSPDPVDVRNYLAEFLSDPHVIRLPYWLAWFQKPLGKIIARSRAQASSDKYKKIWTDRGSPLKTIMADQATALARELPPGWQVFIAMRYGHPTIPETLKQIQSANIDEVVVVSMYPQYSGPTTGTVLRELYRTLRTTAKHLNVSTRATWYDDIGYINAQSRLIADCVTKNGLTPSNTHLVFSVHSLPISYVRSGDPYERHARRTAELVLGRLGWPAERATLGYQSRMGPSQWLAPDTQEVLTRLAQESKKQVIVCPVSFTVDCLETIEEIGIRYRRHFEESGGKLFLCPALNTYEPFIAALKNLVLRGPQPMTSWGEEETPILQTGKNDQKQVNPGELFMIGSSLANGLGFSSGPSLPHTTPEKLHCLKKPHDKIRNLLAECLEQGCIKEGFIWNTCHRFEFYGWLAEGIDDDESRTKTKQLRNILFPGNANDLDLYTLAGYDAWHHLLRSLAGLNSGLPGDTDVIEQYNTAHRIAEQARTAGDGLAFIARRCEKLEHEIRTANGWNELAPAYCYASISGIARDSGFDFTKCRHLVIGGSTTSRSVIEELSDRFGVEKRNITLAYRGHAGGQLKLLRKAIGSGTRLRVQCYSQREIINAIADSDVAFFCIDRDEPVLDMQELNGLRDYESRPLVIIDFNTTGSVAAAKIPGITLYKAEHLDKEVTNFADELCRNTDFVEAARQVELLIEKHVSEITGKDTLKSRLEKTAKILNQAMTGKSITGGKAQ